MVKIRCCETCGHPLPDYEVMMDLTHMQQRLFTIVHKAGRAGIDADAIAERLYSGKSTPDSTNILSVMKVAIQPKLQKHGLKITCRRGPGARWRMESINV